MKRKLQVFISSTFTDLIEERQAAVAATLKAGHIPAGMELFTAADQSQMEIIRRWIDESDVYMLILGGRYGSIESLTGISYTELEYDYAVQQEKPLFAIVINESHLEDKVKSLGSSVIELNANKEMQLFRTKVLSNVSSFYSDLKDIRLCVYESLSDLGARKDLKGWISASEVEDTKALHDEIFRLREENSILQSKYSIADRVKSLPDSNSYEENFIELVKVLESIEIKVPDQAVTTGAGYTTDLYKIFTVYKTILIAGVQNRSSSTALNSFLYFNVCPKLMIHGLVDNEKVTGAQWRRSFVTKFGLEFLAYVDRNKIKSAAQSE